ncbi:unnamed protein product [Fructobacillus tropaeoli]|nr:unnamed protein product [Fructobacillus tropaeoli]
MGKGNDEAGAKVPGQGGIKYSKLEYALKTKLKQYVSIFLIIVSYKFLIVGLIDFIHSHQYDWTNYLLDTSGLLLCFILIDIVYRAIISIFSKR